MTGQEQSIEVNGKTYILSRLTRAIMSEFVQWAKSQLPNVLDVISERIDKFPKDLQELMVKEAVKNSRMQLDFYSDEIQLLMNSPDGLTKMTELLLRKHHPDIQEDEAWEVAMQITEKILESPDGASKSADESTGSIPDVESSTQPDLLTDEGAAAEFTTA
jgi:hypothetical protein